MATVKQDMRKIARALQHNRTRKLESSTPRYLSKSEGAELLDRQARKYLQMSGPEFRDKYRSGVLRGSDHPEVTRVSFLIPLSED